jgi:hypothetical protein
MDGSLMSVPIQVSSDGKTVEPGTSASLFPTHIGGALQGIQRQQYVVSNDGKRFLMNTVADELNAHQGYPELERQTLRPATT